MTTHPVQAAEDTLVVSEVFGPTIQGEGPSTGRRATFIRLGGCNLHCTWCDTSYTWDAHRHDLRAELTRRPVADLVTEIDEHGTGLVVITGGEPLLHQQQPAWSKLLVGLTRLRVDIEVETNGTVKPGNLWAVRYNVSPKLAHAGDPEPARLVPEALDEFAALAHAGTAVFKFVCRTTADLDQVDAIRAAHGIPARAVWIMPEGVDPWRVTAVGRALADPAIGRGYNLTTRLHTLLWPNERSR